MKLQPSKALPLLLIALMLIGQLVFGLHDGGTLDGKHVHSSECAVCFAERLVADESAIAQVLPFVTVDPLPFFVPEVLPVALAPVLRFIRAPPYIR